LQELVLFESIVDAGSKILGSTLVERDIDFLMGFGAIVVQNSVLSFA